MEIERKFLLTELPEACAGLTPVEIRQGYLAVEPEGQEVRIRQKGSKYFLTVKDAGGMVRSEFETEITSSQFDVLWPATEGRRILKYRYNLDFKGFSFEIDDYLDRLKGLKVAEIEFDSEMEARAFIPPAWVGREVTEETRFRNRLLAGVASLTELSNLR